MSGRVAETAAVSALALILTAAVAAPVLRAPSERIFGMEIVGRHHDPFTVMEQFSRPVVVGVYSQPLTDVPGALLARVLGPVTAYNWIVLLTFPLSAVAAFMLARHLGIAPAAAALAGVAFAFSPFHLAQAAYHPHIAQTQWVPLYLFALWRCLDRVTPARMALLAGAVSAVTLSNFYGALIAATITAPAMAAYWLFRARHELRWAGPLAMTTGTLILLAAGGLAYVWFVAPGVLVNRAAFAFPLDDLFRYSANWWSYLVPPVAHPLVGAAAERVWRGAGVREGLLEQQVSLGWGVMALGLVAAFAWTGRDRRAALLAPVPILASVAVVAFMCSLSPLYTIGGLHVVRPSGLLHAVAPMFRSYARFGVVVQLMAVLLAAIGAERLWRSGRRAPRIACLALVALAAAEYTVWPPLLWRDALPTSAHRWVVRQPGHLRVLDCAPLTSESGSVPWLSGNRISFHSPAFPDCREPNLAGKLSAAGFTHILVRRHSNDGRWFATRPLPAGLQVAASFRDSQALAVTAPAPPVYTAGMTAFAPREHDTIWTWRWMGRDASWTVVNAQDRALWAVLDVELMAFQDRRDLTLLLDGRPVQTLRVDAERHVHRIGPLRLAPGEHTLVFRPTDPGAIGFGLVDDGEPRALSFAIGTWRWAVDEARR